MQSKEYIPQPLLNDSLYYRCGTVCQLGCPGNANENTRSNCGWIVGGGYRNTVVHIFPVVQAVDQERVWDVFLGLHPSQLQFESAGVQLAAYDHYNRLVDRLRTLGAVCERLSREEVDHATYAGLFEEVSQAGKDILSLPELVWFWEVGRVTLVIRLH